MTITKLICVVAMLAFPVAFPPSPDNSGTVSIVGTNGQDIDDKKTFGLTLVIANTTWTEVEPGGDTHFFTTKKGTYVRVSNVVSLLDSAKKEVGRLNNIIPASAKKGDKGNGRAEESGIVFNWEVK